MCLNFKNCKFKNILSDVNVIVETPEEINFHQPVLDLFLNARLEIGFIYPIASLCHFCIFKSDLKLILIILCFWLYEAFIWYFVVAKVVSKINGLIFFWTYIFSFCSHILLYYQNLNTVTFFCSCNNKVFIFQYLF